MFKPSPRGTNTFSVPSFSVTTFICSYTGENLPELYMTIAFAEKLARQFLCGKEKISYAKVCSWARFVTENLPHTQRLAVASSVSFLLSIVISGT